MLPALVKVSHKFTGGPWCVRATCQHALPGRQTGGRGVYSPSGPPGTLISLTVNLHDPSGGYERGGRAPSLRLSSRGVQCSRWRQTPLCTHNEGICGHRVWR